MLDRILTAADFPLVQRFKSRRSPLFCRHRHRCDCHLPEPEPALEHAPPADQPPSATPAQLPAACGETEAHRVHNAWLKLFGKVLDVLRDFEEAYDAVAGTVDLICEPGFP